ncbi:MULTISPECIES: hypothetical protein [Methylomonas]|nr:hypothetical protein [Methylomonas koyamae]
MPPSLTKMERFLAERNAASLQRQKDLFDAEKEQLINASLVKAAEAELEPEQSTVKKSKGIGRKLVKAADDKLLEAEQLGLFTSLMVTDNNAIPTLLARLPIFIPIPARHQRSMLDKDMAFAFETPFGRGRRFGPPVTIEDEDVLFAMLQLSGRRLIGQPSKLPVPLNDSSWLHDDRGNLTVQIMIATVGQINKELGINDSGLNYKSTVESIKRLGHVSIELETKKRDLYLGETWTGQTIRLVDIQWQTYKEDGLIFAQFSPLMVKWLREQATYHNWKIRRSIKSANGRALYRFLCTQGNYYKRELDYIADAIHWHGNRSRLRPRIEAVLQQLKEQFNWCDYHIHGTGRSEPFILEFWRQKKS